MVHDSSPCQAGCFESVAEVRSTLVGIERRECGGVLQVTDQMAREAHERGPGVQLGAACLGARMSAPILFQNGHSEDADVN